MGILKKILNKYTNSKEAKNAGWIIIGKIVQMILSFVVSIFSARYLGPSNFGTINYAGAYVAFFSSFCSLGLNAVLIKDFIEKPDEQGVALGTSLIMRLLSSLLSSIMIIGIVSIVDHGEKVTLGVTVLCSVALLFHVFDSINFWFQSRYESKITSFATLLAYVLTSIYKIILLATGKSVYWFAFATSIDYICLAVFLLTAYKKRGGPKFGFSINKGRTLLRKSYHYILSGMMVAIYGQTDKLMLKQMLDETTVGYYSLAASVNGMWVFVLSAIIDSVNPTIISLYSVDKKAYERKNRQLYALVIYISIFVALLLVLFGQFAIEIVYGKEYAPASEPLKIIAWYTMFSYLGVARNAWIVCENKQKYLKYMYFSAAIINVILNFVFIPLMGAVGAAFASLITQICTSIVLPLFIKDMRPNIKLMLEAVILKGFFRKN